jgi:hypothetical protein
MISVHDPSTATALGCLSRFRHAFYQCLTTRADALFELTDAALCGVDHALPALTRGGGSLDLAGDRGPHPASVGPLCGGRPAASVGEKAGHTCSVVPGPCPAGVSQRSTGSCPACQRAEILPAWSWTSSRVTKLSSKPRNTTPARSGKRTLRVKQKA